MISLSKKTLLGLVFIVISSALVWTEALLYSQNNLFFNTNWTIHPSIYSSWSWTENLLGRQLLSENKLSYSFRPTRKRLISRLMFYPKKISFKLSLAPNGHASVFLSHESGVSKGFRFSRNSFIPSAYYLAEKNGKFVSKEIFNLDKFHATGLEVSIENIKEELILSLEGEVIGRFKGTFQKGLLGLDVNQNGEISQIAVVEESGKSTQLSFVREHDFIKLFTLNLIIFSILIGLVWFKSKRDRFTIRLSSGVLSLGILWLGFDYFYYSKMPTEFDFESFASRSPGSRGSINIETVRYRFFESWYRLLGGKTLEPREFFQEHGPLAKKFIRLQCLNYDCEMITEELKPEDKALRIMFLGEHLLSGAGTDLIQDTFHVQVHKTLLSYFRSNSKLQTMNALLFRYNHERRFEEAFKDYQKFKPHFVVISLNEEVQSPESFRELVNHLIKQGTKIVYLYEILNPERYLNVNKPDELTSLIVSRKFFRRRPGMPVFNGDGNSYERLFSDHEIYFIDPNDRIQTSEIWESGILWLDTSVLSAFGQQIAGKIIGEELIKVLKTDARFGSYF